jgi:hypothetical protein
LPSLAEKWKKLVPSIVLLVLKEIIEHLANN